MPNPDGSAAWIEVDPERLETLRTAIGHAFALAEQWLEAAYMRNEPRAIKDAFGELHNHLVTANGEARLLTYREPEPGVFERMLADPTQQFDKDGEVLTSVLAYQGRGCKHVNTTTHPAATMGGSPVTACNDCGVYL